MAGAYDSVCDLECKAKVLTGQRHEFVGPVKIVLVDSTPVDYHRKVWGSAVFTFVMLLLGTTVFTVFFFTLKFHLPFNMNVHILLCTMGFQLFMTTGIMMFSSLFGGSMYLKSLERKIQHFVLEAFGVVFGVLGTLFVLRNMAFTLHAFTGFLAAVLSIITSFVGPIVYAADTEKLFGLYNKKAHRRLGIATFILCSICFALALNKDSFLNWMPIKNLHRILILFTFIYTGTAVMSMVLRLEYDC